MAELLVPVLGRAAPGAGRVVVAIALGFAAARVLGGARVGRAEPERARTAAMNPRRRDGPAEPVRARQAGTV